MTRTLNLVLFCVLVVIVLISLHAGNVWLSPGETWASATAHEANLVGLILSEIRLPRVILACAVGGILGLSGAVLQGLLRNPLAEPGLLGISAGASLGAVISIYYGVATHFTLMTPLFGLAGAFITASITFILSRNGGTLSLILAGAAVSAIAAAGISIALNLAPNPYAAYEIMSWLMGSLADRSWDHVRLALPFISIGAALLLITGRALDALSLGESQAESLGINIGHIRFLALAGTAVGVGAATAVTGAIGFVGLIAPHVVRPLTGHQPSLSLIPSMLFGAIIVTLADIATRTLLIGDMVLNLGVFISLIGAPFFLWLIIHIRSKVI